jgi:hypothetical protein
MKPGDHPDFFRLPPPPGRSRESRIVLDASGRFSNGGVPIDHAAMAEAFASWIRRHPDDGRYILTNGYDWTYFTVEDTPFFVRHVTPLPGGATVLLSDGTEEPLDPSRVTVSEDGVLYAAVKEGAFEARFLAPAQGDMVGLVVESEDGAPGLQMGERVFPILARRGAPDVTRIDGFK